MKLSRHTLMAAVLMASGLVFSMFGSAYAQRATYRTVSGHGYGHGCPCPADCPPADSAAPEAAPEGEEGTDDMGEDLPEVADLTSDAAMASADQSAAPNAIGDSLAPGYTFSGIYGTANFAPGGGRRFKATNNNSAIPQCRVFFNYNYFDNAYSATANGNPPVTQSINVRQYEFGAEHAFWCGMASIQLRVPLITSFDNDIDFNAFPFGTDTQFGNVNVSLKGVLYSDCVKTVSAGLGIGLPTADDFVANDNVGTYSLDNDAVILSPYLAVYSGLGCNAFLNGFAQVSLPVNDNDVSFDDGVNPVVAGSISDTTLLYLDLSVGYWLNQDCCGNGVAAIAELHYTDALDDDAVAIGGANLATGDFNMLNATVGAAVIRGCWSVAPAVVLPVLDGNNRAFDWEFAMYVNRRF